MACLVTTPASCAQLLTFTVKTIEGASAYENPILSHEYFPPSSLYQEVLSQAARSLKSPTGQVKSAGWIRPRNVRGCPPIFIAHSLTSAIWLLQNSLPENTLLEREWEKLLQAACPTLLPTTPLEVDTSLLSSPLPPPSAQQSRLSHHRPGVLPLDTSDEEEDGNICMLDVSREDNEEQEEEEEEEGDREGTPGLEEEQQEREQDDPSIAEEESRIGVLVTTNWTKASMKKHEVTLQKRRIVRQASLGLITPTPKAPAIEQAAYQSILQEDEHIISWIFTRPVGDYDFFHTAKTPYHTALSMVKKARELGNITSRLHASSFLSTWRVNGSPLPSPAVPRSTSSMPMASTSSYPPILALTQATQGKAVSFPSVWNIVSYCETQLAAVHVQYRWAMAFLARAYEEETERLKEVDRLAIQDQSGRGGRGRVRSEAKRNLYNTLQGVPWETFGTRLKRAQRWYTAVKCIGWGSLCLMPYDVILTTWVEQTLRTLEWDLWLQVVPKVNPEAIIASQHLDHFLGAESIAGGPITQTQLLGIEAAYLQNQQRVEEIPDSEEDEDEEMEDLGASLEEGPTSSSSSPSASFPKKRLQQLRITELFQPIGSISR